MATPCCLRCRSPHSAISRPVCPFGCSHLEQTNPKLPFPPIPPASLTLQPDISASPLFFSGDLTHLGEPQWPAPPSSFGHAYPSDYRYLSSLLSSYNVFHRTKNNFEPTQIPVLRRSQRDFFFASPSLIRCRHPRHRETSPPPRSPPSLDHPDHPTSTSAATTGPGKQLINHYVLRLLDYSKVLS